MSGLIRKYVTKSRIVGHRYLIAFVLCLYLNYQIAFMMIGTLFHYAAFGGPIHTTGGDLHVFIDRGEILFTIVAAMLMVTVLTADGILMIAIDFFERKGMIAK